MKPPALVLLCLAVLAAADPSVFLIRHGEKPSDPNDHGLSEKGKQRAQCLRTVFGAGSPYNIGHIMAEKPKKNGARTRPLDTVAPLAADLGLEVDVSCKQQDTECVKGVVDNYDGPGNILICWEHKVLNEIAEALGAGDVGSYPGDAFNLIWTDPFPYTEIVSVTSQNCPGLDN